jgi:hypothetical protein
LALSTTARIDSAVIEEICGLHDDVYRNLWITFAYSEIADRLTAFLGGVDSNWCTFSRWSSATIGENLVLDGSSVRVDDLCARRPVVRLFRPALERVQREIRLASDQAMPRVLALGNRLVFHEIGYALSQFLDWCDANPNATDAEWQQFRASVVAGDASELFRECEVEWLRTGMDAYFRASRTTDPMKRAQLVLRGNVYLAAYEQWRVDPMLRLALDPLASRLVEFCAMNPHAAPGDRPHAVLRHSGTRWALVHQSFVGRWIASTYASLMTRFVLTLDAPFRSDAVNALPLGRGLPMIGDGTRFRPPLSVLTDPDTRQLMSLYDDGRARIAATDWTRFTDRMQFISALFRSEQQNERLRAPIADDKRRILDLDVSDANLDALRQLGDPAVDTAVDAYARGTSTDPRELVGQLIRNGVRTAQTAAITTGAVPNVDRPTWAVDDKLTRGRGFFQTHGMEIAASLFAASLPRSYTAARGARVLTATAELASGNTARRLAETGQMLFDLMADDDPPLGPKTRAAQAAHGVRVFHSTVRHMLHHDPDAAWDTARDGVPINQEDLLGALVVFTVVVLDALEQMGVDVDPDDRDAYVHLWLVVGHQLGINYELIRPEKLQGDAEPLNAAELRIIGTAIFRRNAHASPGGQTLTAALLETCAESMPRALKGFPAAATRRLIGDEAADLLEVPPAGPATLLFQVIRPVARLMSPRLAGKYLSGFSRMATQTMYQRWIDAERGNRPPWRIDRKLADQFGLRPAPTTDVVEK